MDDDWGKCRTCADWDGNPDQGATGRCMSVVAVYRDCDTPPNRTCPDYRPVQIRSKVSDTPVLE